ncbi:hypothetical protein NDU88_003160 [Pleurodeles waltl]|uniref:Uncharacterized protein n=1 Tax=Pleurodeles waltl TaxID=8319 RepID=A0AAV7LRA5_PLEWA|nr:hypothetical protein NDU88_003160 [Pleurodeles waltl]
MNDLQIQMTADFSKETSVRRKAFLALRPRLRQLEIKFGLFEPARFGITKNNVSKDFYDPTDLSLYLNSFSDHPMDTASWLPSQALITMARNSLPMETTLERPDHDPSENSNRGRDLERLSKIHDPIFRPSHPLLLILVLVFRLACLLALVQVPTFSSPIAHVFSLLTL